jgi:hypothetical protein
MRRLWVNLYQERSKPDTLKKIFESIKTKGPNLGNQDGTK